MHGPAPSCKHEGAVEFWGSQHADARCVVGDQDVGWAKSSIAEVAARLRHAGFRHVEGPFGAMQSVWHHLNSSESLWDRA